MGFWERVKEEIIKQNTTQEWVANAVGMDHGAFRSALSKKQEPRISKAISVAKALGVTVEYMVYGRKQPSKNEIDDKIIKLALKHKEILEIFETMDDNTLEMVIDQIMVVVRSKNRELKEVAERKEKYGEKKAT